MKQTLLAQTLLLLGLAFLPAVGQALYLRQAVSWDAPAVAPDEVVLEEALGWGESLLWVDARPDAEFEHEHIPGALSLNEDRWTELLQPFLTTWAPEKRTVVYCSSQSCAASHEVARRLREEAGLKSVFVLHGGWETWLEAKK